jgi:hypothetical protein
MRLSKSLVAACGSLCTFKICRPSAAENFPVLVASNEQDQNGACPYWVAIFFWDQKVANTHTLEDRLEQT